MSFGCTYQQLRTADMFFQSQLVTVLSAISKDSIRVLN